MKNISLIFSYTEAELQKYVLRILMDKQDSLNLSLFSDQTLNISLNSVAMLPKSDVLSFTGDLLCTNPLDVKLALCAERNINIKFLCHEHFLGMQDWFNNEENIEYLIAFDNTEFPENQLSYRNLIESMVGLKNIRTLNEYLS